MKLENSIFEDDYRTSFTHTGMQSVLTNRSFLLLMENLAGAHSNYCHFSFNDISDKNVTWVLLNWKLQVFHRPRADENIRIQTWGRFFNKVFVIRDFKMLDSDGNVCAIASSKWCLLDTQKGGIAAMPANLPDIYHGFIDDSVFNIDDLPRLKVPESEPIKEDTYKIRRFDLDLNKHVHNLNYLNYAYEVLPDEIFNGNEFNNVEIAYKKEIKLGEVIRTFLYVDDGVYTIVIKSEDEKTIHSIIKLYN